MEIFPIKGHSKIWSANFFIRPPETRRQVSAHEVECYLNESGMRGEKEEGKVTKEKMDGWDTRSNRNEAGGTKRQKGNNGEGFAMMVVALLVECSS